EGEAMLFRDGKRYDGRWVRPTREDLIGLRTTDRPLLYLKPGETWVQVVRPTDQQHTDEEWVRGASRSTLALNVVGRDDLDAQVRHEDERFPAPIRHLGFIVGQPRRLISHYVGDARACHRANGIIRAKFPLFPIIESNLSITKGHRLSCHIAMPNRELLQSRRVTSRKGRGC